MALDFSNFEAGEIEHHIRTLTPEGATVIVEVLSSASTLHGGALTAFITMDGDWDDLPIANTSKGLSLIDDDAVDRALAKVQSSLRDHLPTFMIPSLLVPLLAWPLNLSGKVDRLQLRNFIVDASPSDMTRMGQKDNDRQLPASEAETILHGLWQAVLRLPAEAIGRDDSFLSLGGDSIQAMRLVREARSHGLQIGVGDILGAPKLSKMALSLKSSRSEEALTEKTRTKPFSLLNAQDIRQDIELQLEAKGIDKQSIQDIMPTTDEQARYISTTYTAARTMLQYHNSDGVGEPDIAKMRYACSQLVRRFDILRTVFVAHGNTFYQVVLGGIDLPIPVHKATSKTLNQVAEEIRQHDMQAPLRFGAPLVTFNIIYQVPEQKWRLLLRMSHAQYDGTSLAKIWDAFDVLLDGGGASSIADSSFSHHIHAISDTSAAKGYWSKLLDNSFMTSLKQQSSHELRRSEGPHVSVKIPQTKLHSDNFTFSTVLKAAWAYVLARSSACDDVVYGSLTSGRNHPESQNVVGPCLNVIPMRIRFGTGWTTTDLLTAVNAQTVASLPHEHLGPRELIRSCTEWPRWQYFSSVVIHQNYEDIEEEDSTRSFHDGNADLKLGDVDNVELFITSQPRGENMEIDLGFAAGVMPEVMAHQLADKLRETILSFYDALDAPLLSSTGLLGLSPSFPLRSDSTTAYEARAHDTLQAARCPKDVREALGEAWMSVLDCDYVPDIDDPTPFFHQGAGGDLIGACQMTAHMERQGFELPVEEVFEYPTWCLLLGALSRRYA